MRLDQVKSRIISAFQSEKIPEEIVPGEYRDIEGSEYQQVYDFLISKGSWENVKWSDLQSYKGDPSAILHFLSLAGLRYFLPAFLLAVIEHLDEADILIDVIVELFYSANSSYAYKDVWHSLSREQKAVYFQVLSYISQRLPDDYGTICGKVINDLTETA